MSPLFPLLLLLPSGIAEYIGSSESSLSASWYYPYGAHIKTIAASPMNLVVCEDPELDQRCWAYRNEYSDWNAASSDGLYAPPGFSFSSLVDFGRHTATAGNWTIITSLTQNNLQWKCHVFAYTYKVVNQYEDWVTKEVTTIYDWVVEDIGEFIIVNRQEFKIAVDESGVVAVWGMKSPAVGIGVLMIYQNVDGTWTENEHNPTYSDQIDEVAIQDGGDLIAVLTSESSGPTFHIIQSHHNYDFSIGKRISFYRSMIYGFDNDELIYEHATWIGRVLLISLRGRTEILMYDLDYPTQVQKKELHLPTVHMSSFENTLYTTSVNPSTNTTVIDIWTKLSGSIEMVHVGNIVGHCLTYEEEDQVEAISASAESLFLLTPMCGNLWNFEVSDILVEEITTTGGPYSPCTVEAYSFWNGAILEVIDANITDPLICNIECQSRPECAFWSWEIERFECTLRTVSWGKSENVAYVSGSRCEGIPPTVCFETEASETYQICLNEYHRLVGIYMDSETWANNTGTQCLAMNYFVSCLNNLPPNCVSLLGPDLSQYREDNCRFALCDRTSDEYNLCVHEYNNANVESCEAMDNFQVCIERILCDITDYHKSLRYQCTVTAPVNEDEDQDSGLSLLMIVGIALSGTVLLLLLCCVFCMPSKPTPGTSPRPSPTKKRDPAFRITVVGSDGETKRHPGASRAAKDAKRQPEQKRRPRTLHQKIFEGLDADDIPPYRSRSHSRARSTSSGRGGTVTRI